MRVAAVAALLSGLTVGLVGALIVSAAPAWAQSPAPDPALAGVIDRLRNLMVGLLVALSTLFITIGGFRYLLAGGDPGQVEKAKMALRYAAFGYAVAALAPLLTRLLKSVIGV